MSAKRIILSLGFLAFAGFSQAHAFEKIAFQGGTQMGYSYGQNGVGWPALAKDPLGNPGRGGFYISQLRLQARIDFDSTFSGVAVGNLVFSELQELYLLKKWGSYRFKAGKFRGAGLKSATGTDEFGRLTFNPPYYARLWAVYKKTLNFRDFGIQVERDFLDGNLQNRLFVHNANGENVFNDEPSFPAGKSTQVLGVDYAVDWRISPFTMWGAHIGALADRSWDDFVGEHEGWEAGYWFKTNAIVDGSLNHKMDLGRFHMFNEAVLLLNRNLPNPADSAATRTWGVSSLVSFDASKKAAPFFQYEFNDHTDGFFQDDALHIFTLGGVFHPAPAAYPDLKTTAAYVRAYEDGFENRLANDILHIRLQMLF